MTPNTSTDWYAPLRDHLSLGRTTARPGSLAGLAAARRENLAQFFTPDAVAALLWRILAPAIAPLREHRLATLLDTSIGSGRLLQFADPAHHALYGADVHGPTIAALVGATTAAGFRGNIVHAGLETLRPHGFDAALINPPYSIPIQSPLLAPYDCTTWGRFGPNTSTVSHAYALAQALEAAQVALAVVPLSLAEAERDMGASERLRAVLVLPRGSFRTEGTDVDTAVLVYGPVRRAQAPVTLTLGTLDDALPDFDLTLPREQRHARAQLGARTVEDTAPAITRPVTGDATVRVIKDGRKLGLRFACGFTEARVLNAILNGPVPQDATVPHRYPKNVRWIGGGWFDVENYLGQPDPVAAFEEFLGLIRSAGGVPRPDPGLVPFLRRRNRQRLRQATPFRHVVRGPGGPKAGDIVEAVARAHRPLDPKRWGSPVLFKGQAYAFAFDGARYTHTHASGATLTLEPEQLAKDFAVAPAGENTGWRDAYPGRLVAYPELARALRQVVHRTGGDRVASWDFQINDVVELLMAPGGVMAGQMGVGKTRIGLALALAGGEHNVVAVEAHLVGEIVDQIREVGLPDDAWQVIRSPAQCEQLRRINVISYSRLRREITPGAGRRTYARLLRRRVHTVIADEAHLLRSDSEQSRALWMLSPKRRYALTGTPAASYPRDMVPLAQWACGDGTLAQPFGAHHPYFEPRNLRSLSYTSRGNDVFRERHVTLEWVTAEAEDSLLRKGGKREIPRARNLPALREWAACILKRRLTAEPEVAAHFHPHEVSVAVRRVAWHADHLAHYLELADEFASWYRQARADADAKGRNLSMITLLARIGAVQRASTFPQHPHAHFHYTGGLTSKQEAVIARAAELAAEGHKTIVYVEQPGMVDMVVAELVARGVEAVPFHGQLPIVARTRELNRRFRYGDAPVLVATYGTVQTGLNLYQADRGLLACRQWTSKAEQQAMARLLRPQQTKPVEFEIFELEGSLDTYMGQMVAHKQDAADAVIDFLEPELDDVEFLHLDQILNNFVADLAERAGLNAAEYREKLKHVA